MPKFRKKPVVIEAIQFKDDSDCILQIAEMMDLNEIRVNYNDPNHPFIPIETLEGTMNASLNDYIIKGVNNEFYPCKPDIFEKTYEPVNENPSPCSACGQDTASCCGCDKYYEWKDGK
jgi:hypothetical protein